MSMFENECDDFDSIFDSWKSIWRVDGRVWFDYDKLENEGLMIEFFSEDFWNLNSRRIECSRSTRKKGVGIDDIRLALKLC